MSEFWSESLSEVANRQVVCAICGKASCKGDSDQDPRETAPSTPLHAIDEPLEETR